VFTTIRSVTVVSQDNLHALMVPKPSVLPFSTQFHNFTAYRDAGPRGPEAGLPGHLTVLVNPDRFSPEDMESISGPLVWWFIDPLGDLSDEDWGGFPHLGHHAATTLDTRRSIFDRAFKKPDAVVVSDQQSREWVSQHQATVIISPPPVSDSIFRDTNSESSAICLGFIGEPSLFSALFLDQLEIGVARVALPSSDVEEIGALLAPYSSMIAAGGSPQRGFPYEAAVCLALGIPLLSRPLAPLHGLEPGVDYLEYISPEELKHATNYIGRSPQALNLMAYRGRRKAEYFRASDVWPKVVANLAMA